MADGERSRRHSSTKTPLEYGGVSKRYIEWLLEDMKRVLKGQYQIEDAHLAVKSVLVIIVTLAIIVTLVIIVCLVIIMTLVIIVSPVIISSKSQSRSAVVHERQSNHPQSLICLYPNPAKL
jgi:uncharacterized membrane protein